MILQYFCDPLEQVKILFQVQECNSGRTLIIIYLRHVYNNYYYNIFKHNLECLFQRFVSIISKEHVPMETVAALTMSSHHLEGICTVYLI